MGKGEFLTTTLQLVMQHIWKQWELANDYSTHTHRLRRLCKDERGLCKDEGKIRTLSFYNFTIQNGWSFLNFYWPPDVTISEAKCRFYEDKIIVLLLSLRSGEIYKQWHANDLLPGEREEKQRKILATSGCTSDFFFFKKKQKNKTKKSDLQSVVIMHEGRSRWEGEIHVF